jgi:transposase
MTNISETYVGVDVSKNHLDIYIHPVGQSFKIKNSKEEVQKFIKTLDKYDNPIIGCEATGGYEKTLAQALKGSSYDLWIIDPRRVKGFIVASGCKSKTDKIDARKIAEFVSKNSKDYQAIIKTANEEQLQAFVNRRNDLKKFLVADKARLDHPSHALCSSDINKFISILENEIKEIDQRIKSIIESDVDLKQKSEILESIPGFGKATAAMLLSHVQELGKVNKNQIAALVGVCPYENESGKHKGKKAIRGGRADPRNMLYMCALTAIKYNPVLKSFYERLIANKKPFKVAIVAVMRKLIILANSLLKKGELCKV